MNWIWNFVPSFYHLITIFTFLLILNKFGRKIFEFLITSLLHFGFSKQASNSKKDLLYLYVFNRLRYAPNPSPFCVKVEAFLRSHNIPHKVVFSFFERSREGLLPFIEMNGIQICDSQLILLELEKRFNLQNKFSDEENAKIRAIDRMIDSSIGNAIFYIKFKMHGREIRALYEKMLPLIYARMMYISMRDKVYKKLAGATMLEYTKEEVLLILKTDFKTIEKILGHGIGPYLFGANPSIADFTLFGHLSVSFYLPFSNPIQDLLNDEFPLIKAHMKLMLRNCFPEYETLPDLGYIR